MNENRDNRNREIDWSRYGLGSETAQRQRAHTSGFIDLSNDYGAGGHQASGANELFAEEQVIILQNISERTLFIFKLLNNFF